MMLTQININCKMEPQKYTRIMAGTVAGWAMVTAGQPLDYLKTLYQVLDHKIPSIRSIYQQMGIRGFYKGASSVYLLVGAATAMQFETFERSSELFTRLGLQQQSNPNVLCLMMSGIMTGMFCSLLYTPTQYAKILCQIQHRPTQGSAAMIFQVIAKQKIIGLRRLYTGFGITVLKQSPGLAIYYGGYYVALTKIFGHDRNSAHLWTQLVSGSLAGIMYQMYAYPFDVIKTNIQSGRKQFIDMIKSKFWKTSNFKEGLKLSVLRSALVDALNFTVYENLRKIFSDQYVQFAKKRF